MMVMRFGAGSMLLWFGMDKWSNPVAWAGWLPSWLGYFPVHDNVIVALVGLGEFGMGLALLATWRTRWVSLAAAVGIIALNVAVGVTDATVRDSAVIGVLLSLMIHDNAQSKTPWGTRTISVLSTCYVALLLIVGILFLKSV